MQNHIAAEVYIPRFGIAQRINDKKSHGRTSIGSGSDSRAHPCPTEHIAARPRLVSHTPQSHASRMTNVKNQQASISSQHTLHAQTTSHTSVIRCDGAHPLLVDDHVAEDVSLLAQDDYHFIFATLSWNIDLLRLLLQSAASPLIVAAASVVAGKSLPAQHASCDEQSVDSEGGHDESESAVQSGGSVTNSGVSPAPASCLSHPLHKWSELFKTSQHQLQHCQPLQQQQQNSNKYACPAAVVATTASTVDPSERHKDINENASNTSMDEAKCTMWAQSCEDARCNTIFDSGYYFPTLTEMQQQQEHSKAQQQQRRQQQKQQNSRRRARSFDTAMRNASGVDAIKKVESSEHKSTVRAKVEKLCDAAKNETSLPGVEAHCLVDEPNLAAPASSAKNDVTIRSTRQDDSTWRDDESCTSQLGVTYVRAQESSNDVEEHARAVQCEQTSVSSASERNSSSTLSQLEQKQEQKKPSTLLQIPSPPIENRHVRRHRKRRLKQQKWAALYRISCGGGLCHESRSGMIRWAELSPSASASSTSSIISPINNSDDTNDNCNVSRSTRDARDDKARAAHLINYDHNSCATSTHDSSEDVHKDADSSRTYDGVDSLSSCGLSSASILAQAEQTDITRVAHKKTCLSEMRQARPEEDGSIPCAPHDEQEAVKGGQAITNDNDLCYDGDEEYDEDVNEDEIDDMEESLLCMTRRSRRGERFALHSLRYGCTKKQQYVSFGVHRNHSSACNDYYDKANHSANKNINNDDNVRTTDVQQRGIHTTITFPALVPDTGDTHTQVEVEETVQTAATRACDNKPAAPVRSTVDYFLQLFLRAVFVVVVAQVRLNSGSGTEDEKSVSHASGTPAAQRRPSASICESFAMEDDSNSYSHTSSSSSSSISSSANKDSDSTDTATSDFIEQMHVTDLDRTTAHMLTRAERAALLFVRAHMSAFRDMITRFVMRSEKEAMRRSAQALFTADSAEHVAARTTPHTIAEMQEDCALAVMETATKHEKQDQEQTFCAHGSALYTQRTLQLLLHSQIVAQARSCVSVDDSGNRYAHVKDRRQEGNRDEDAYKGKASCAHWATHQLSNTNSSTNPNSSYYLAHGRSSAADGLFDKEHEKAWGVGGLRRRVSQVQPLRTSQIYLSGKDAAWQPVLLDLLNITRVLQCYADRAPTSPSRMPAAWLSNLSTHSSNNSIDDSNNNNNHHHVCSAVPGSSTARYVSELSLTHQERILRALHTFLLDHTIAPIRARDSACAGDVHVKLSDTLLACLTPHLGVQPSALRKEKHEEDARLCHAWPMSCGILSALHWCPYRTRTEAEEHGADAHTSTDASVDETSSCFGGHGIDVARLPISGRCIYRYVIPAEDTAEFDLSRYFDEKVFDFLQGIELPPCTSSASNDADASRATSSADHDSMLPLQKQEIASLSCRSSSNKAECNESGACVLHRQTTSPSRDTVHALAQSIHRSAVAATGQTTTSTTQAAAEVASSFSPRAEQRDTHRAGLSATTAVQPTQSVGKHTHRRCKQSGEAALVHCSAGMHRSSGMVAAYLLHLAAQCDTILRCLGIRAGRNASADLVNCNEHHNATAANSDDEVHCTRPSEVSDQMLRVCLLHIRQKRSIAQPIDSVVQQLRSYAATLGLS